MLKKQYFLFFFKFLIDLKSPLIKSFDLNSKSSLSKTNIVKYFCKKYKNTEQITEKKFQGNSKFHRIKNSI